MVEISMDDIGRMVGLYLGIRTVHHDDRFMEDLGAESADIAIIITAVEERFNISIKESEIARIITPQDLFDLIKRKTQWD